MQTRSYCGACGHWGRRAVITHLFNVVSQPVKVDIENIDTERCDTCKRTFVTREVMKATLRAVVEGVVDYDPTLRTPTIRQIAERVARALQVGEKGVCPRGAALWA